MLSRKHALPLVGNQPRKDQITYRKQNKKQHKKTTLLVYHLAFDHLPLQLLRSVLKVH